jgi:FKBP-type peptidyl-prolyl cis-trans isomerase 2
VDGKKEKLTKKMIEVNFTGKELLNETIFDTTIENVAKEHNIYDKNRAYNSLTIILGENELHKKVEEELFKMNVGEEKTVHLNPKEGFGERNLDLVRVVPLKVFHDQKIKPVPGLMINLGNAIAKVQSVSGGRVRIDINHPLAGRELEYTVKVVKEITAHKEIAEKLFEKYYSRIPSVTKTITENKLSVTLPKETLNGLENVNKSITNLAKELGIELVVTGKDKVETKKVENKEEKK